MNIDTCGTNQHPDEVNPGRFHLTSKLVDLTSLGVINGIDRVIVSPDGSHLDRDPLGTVHSQKIDFSLAHHDIGRDDIHAMTGKKFRGQLLAELAKTPA